MIMNSINCQQVPRLHGTYGHTSYVCSLQWLPMSSLQGLGEHIHKGHYRVHVQPPHHYHSDSASLITDTDRDDE